MSFLLSEGMHYHIDNDVPIRESVYRPGSKSFFAFILEAKKAYRKGLIEADEYDHDLLSSDIGEYGEYNGGFVPLDYPIPAELDESVDNMDSIDEKRKRKRKKKKSKSKSGSFYQGKKVQLNKPKRGGSKKFYVYVKNPKTGKVKKISFGAKGMSVGLKDAARRKSFVARHKCKEKKDKTKAGYWACRIGRYPHLFGGKQKYTWW
jgi:hypothetical protein